MKYVMRWATRMAISIACLACNHYEILIIWIGELANWRIGGTGFRGLHIALFVLLKAAALVHLYDIKHGEWRGAANL